VSERPNTSNEIEDTVTSTDDHPLGTFIGNKMFLMTSFVRRSG
jgi:hypothetical protein